ncbi:MAG: CAAD domain-containing protein [Limnoraphis sp.]
MEPEITRLNNNPEPEINKPKNVNKESQFEEINVEVEKPFDDGLNENLFQENESYKEKFLLFGYQASNFIDNVPDYIKYFWSAYKQVIFVFVYALLALLIFVIITTIIKALDGLPLIATFFQSVGILYTIWFSFRYIITAEKRRKLISNFNELKKNVIG